MESTERVRNHFERDAQRFDAIYDEEKKSAFARFVDKYVRGVVVERLHLVRALAPAKGEWSVLDVGCGPGRFSVDLARRGASRVLGVDISKEMLDLARRAAVSQKVETRCEFVVSSFHDLPVKETFDMSLGIGYFDYLEDPIEDLQKMARFTRGHLVASFPKRFEWRVPIRKVRFLLTGGFVRFYSKGEILRLFGAIGVPRDRLYLIDLGRDYVAVARVV
jgi:ubiquinone/menaquinone biosynthesis C-methylase UbiE